VEALKEGKFITFEGGEGAGKTTQIKILGERLTAEGYKVMMTREPGGTPISDKIRAVLLDSAHANMCKQTEFLLYTAARAQHVQEVIIPALKEGYIVICDRFVDSTVVYQYYVRKAVTMAMIEEMNSYLACDQEQLLQPHYGVERFKTPDLTFLLDINAEAGLGRSLRQHAVVEAAGGADEKRFEMEGLQFHERVNHFYREIGHDVLNQRRIKILDASLPLETLAERIHYEITELLA
jgi:dTMP kinase